MTLLVKFTPMVDLPSPPPVAPDETMTAVANDPTVSVTPVITQNGNPVTP